MDGTFWVFAAEALMIPTGLLTAAFLTRRLGPGAYGLLTITASFIAWLEWTINSFFGRATVKLLGDTKDWKSVGIAVINLQLAVSAGIAGVLWFLAPAVASFFDEPIMTGYIRLFCLDIPIFCTAIAYRHILIGLGSFRKRAFSSTMRWISRLILIVFLVEIGLSIEGAILAMIGASFVELCINYYYVRILPFQRTQFSLRRLCVYSLPLILYAASLRLYDRLDLFSLKALGGSAEIIGIYAASQSLSLVPAIFATAFVPTLLSILTRLHRIGDTESFKRISRHAFRFVIGLLPFAAMTAGMSLEIVHTAFGPHFLRAAHLLAILIFGSLSMLMIAVTTAILIARGKPRWTFVLAGPLIPVSLAGYLWIIPQWGAVGAAWVTTACAVSGAAVMILAVNRLCGISFPRLTFARSAILSIATYFLANLWMVYSYLLVLKILIIAGVIGLGFLLLGEFTATEINKVRSIFTEPRVSQEDPLESP